MVTALILMCSYQNSLYPSPIPLSKSSLEQLCITNVISKLLSKKAQKKGGISNFTEMEVKHRSQGKLVLKWILMLLSLFLTVNLITAILPGTTTLTTTIIVIAGLPHYYYQQQYLTRPSALGMSDPIQGPLIHIFVDEEEVRRIRFLDQVNYEYTAL